ncbi:hypothetical protein SADUNF_Sadunf12G0056200 [Salix dunnii]|uniref:Uncharacterized protein n=1 Tax=Salix dunnii TaxID=1413687 RepID=A0A835JLR6_9ROSI|nr:hypothetical protein SADUNF_Sadunf12G0056200 [Salix dunnii]
MLILSPTLFLKSSLTLLAELNAQVGSALCLAAAIDAELGPEPGRPGEVMVRKLERLVRSEGYKAKFAGLVVKGSVIGVGGVRGVGGGIGGLANRGESVVFMVLLISIWDHKNSFELEFSSDFNPYL